MDARTEQIARTIVGGALTDEQMIALGFRPRTLRGWVFWLRYWSPIAAWVRRLVARI